MKALNSVSSLILALLLLSCSHTSHAPSKKLLSKRKHLKGHYFHGLKKAQHSVKSTQTTYAENTVQTQQQTPYNFNKESVIKPTKMASSVVTTGNTLEIKRPAKSIANGIDITPPPLLKLQGDTIEYYKKKSEYDEYREYLTQKAKKSKTLAIVMTIAGAILMSIPVLGVIILAFAISRWSKTSEYQAKIQALEWEEKLEKAQDQYERQRIKDRIRTIAIAASLQAKNNSLIAWTCLLLSIVAAIAGIYTIAILASYYGLLLLLGGIALFVAFIIFLIKHFYQRNKADAFEELEYYR